MPTKTSVPSNSRSKRKPTRAHSWHDADGVQNETDERNEAFRRAILAIPAGKVCTYGGVAAALLPASKWSEPSTALQKS